MSRTCGTAPGGLGLELAALLDPEAVLLIDDDQTESGERHRLRQQRVGPDDDAGLAGLDRLVGSRFASAAQRTGQEGDGDRQVLEQRSPIVSRCWRASRSVGASRAPWRPSSAARASAWAATAVLPDPTSPWRSRSIGSVAGQVGPDGDDRDDLVGRQLDRPADPPLERRR